MIAPLRTEKKTQTSRRLSGAHAMIAAIFLPSRQTAPPPIAAWKAWLFIVWVGLVLVAYALSMAGLPLSTAGLLPSEPRSGVIPFFAKRGTIATNSEFDSFSVAEMQNAKCKMQNAKCKMAQAEFGLS